MMPTERDLPAFERAAATYDAETCSNPAMAYMRAISLATLEHVFAPGQRLLEIGCGTGQEAVALAQRGCHVLATDTSPAMLAQAQTKAQAAGVAGRVHTQLASAAELASLTGLPLFDGAYSSFGPLNALPNLAPFMAALATLVRPGGAVVLSVMNRCYPLEIGWFLAHGQVRQALRRWRGALASVSTGSPEQMWTYYHSVRAMRRAARPWFALRWCRALPLLLPPPYLADVWGAHPWLVAQLRVIEERLAPHWPWNRLGDHWLVELERTAVASSRLFGGIRQERPAKGLTSEERSASILAQGHERLM
jgi:SAM-dependent methyltransferase